MGFDPVTAGLALAGSYFGGKSERAAAHEADRQNRALIQQIIAQAEAVYGKEGTEAAVQRAIEEVAQRQAQTAMGVESNLYGRGMGERTAGPLAALAGQAMKEKLSARRDIEAEYPSRLLAAKQGMLGPTADYAQRKAASAGEMTALPINIVSLFAGMNQKSPWDEYMAGKTTAPGGYTGNTFSGALGLDPVMFTTGWKNMDTYANKKR